MFLPRDGSGDLLFQLGALPLTVCIHDKLGQVWREYIIQIKTICWTSKLRIPKSLNFWYNGLVMFSVTPKKAFLKTIKTFAQTFPIIIGVFFLIALFEAVFPKEIFARTFFGNDILDTLIGAFFGSISGGSPLTSYVIGGELLRQGVGLAAVTAFILAWVSVGIIQFPAESLMLGKKFAFVRNAVSFVSALAVALLTALTLACI